MKTTGRLSAIFLVGVYAAYGEPAAPLTLVQTIALEDVPGRIDHMCIDRENKRLYVAALGANAVEVIDLAAGKRIDTLKGPKEPQGVAVIPNNHSLVVASGADGMFRVYNTSGKQTGALANLDDADNVRFDAQSGLVYVGYGAGALAVVDPIATKGIRETKLKGHPESFQIEEVGARVFVNVPTARHVAVLDKRNGNMLAEWPVAEAESNFPMALDEQDHRLFVGCRSPAKLVVFDTETGKSVTSVDCCGDTDDVFWDAKLKRIYVSGGQGCVTVIDATDADHYRQTATIPTVAGARTSFFDRDSGHLYVAIPSHGSHAAEIRVYRAQR